MNAEQTAILHAAAALLQSEINDDWDLRKRIRMNLDYSTSMTREIFGIAFNCLHEFENIKELITICGGALEEVFLYDPYLPVIIVFLHFFLNSFSPLPSYNDPKIEAICSCFREKKFLTKFKANLSRKIIGKKVRHALELERFIPFDGLPAVPLYGRVNLVENSIDRALEYLMKFNISFEQDALLPDCVRFLPPVPNSPSLNQYFVFQPKEFSMCVHSLLPLTGDVIITSPDGLLIAHHLASLARGFVVHVFGVKTKHTYELLIPLKRKRSNLVLHEEEFFSVNPSETSANIDTVICLPSCSRLGLLDPLDWFIRNGCASACVGPAVEQLGGGALPDAQKGTLYHAFKFETVRRVLYFVHSPHTSEGEEIVESVLFHQNTEPVYNLAPLFTERDWPTRGHDWVYSKDFGHHCIRGGEHTATNVFFMALFSRDLRLGALMEVSSTESLEPEPSGDAAVRRPKLRSLAAASEPVLPKKRRNSLKPMRRKSIQGGKGMGFGSSVPRFPPIAKEDKAFAASPSYERRKSRTRAEHKRNMRHAMQPTESSKAKQRSDHVGPADG